MRNWLSRLAGRLRPDGGVDEVQTARIDVPGIGALTMSGRPASDPFIFGRLQRGEMFEPHILAALRALTPRGASFLDVGANIGVFSLCAARLVGPNGRVVAVEPAPGNLSLLRRNLRDNRSVAGASVRVLGAAASDRRGTASLALSPDNAGDHRLGSRSRPGRQRVRTIRLDEARLSMIRPLVVKLDIQGAEVAAMRGLAGVLDAPGPTRVLVEYWPFGLQDCGSSAEELVELLQSRFAHFWLLWSHCGPLPTDPAELRRLAVENLAPRTEMFADIVALQEGDAAGVAAMSALAAAGL